MGLGSCDELATGTGLSIDAVRAFVDALNQVERWFGLLSQRAIKRGSFRSVADLVRKIQAFIDSYNTSATPFVWVATAQSILDKVARIAMRISETAHAAFTAQSRNGSRLQVGPQLCRGLVAGSPRSNA